ncbi:MAG TPA: glycosyltransferase family 4 protein [Pseudonocardia sp.]|jgi:hypothetical protein|nr:glycosyltransferase family 4 protein [Pseudonocardia sp.]
MVNCVPGSAGPKPAEVVISGRICLVSHRLGGISGVSLEAAKWQSAFEGLGWSVTRAAGEFFDHQDGDVIAPGLWSLKPGDDPPPVDHTTITRLLDTHDVLVLDNAGSLWTAPEASMAWEGHALDAGIPTIVRHHDPPWQGVPLREVPPDTIPLHHPSHLHVVINQLTYDEFDKRWPRLRQAGALRIVHNLVDAAALLGGDRDATRKHLGVGAEEILLAHPARAIGARKNIPGAVEFARALDKALDRTVRYWITDGSEALFNPENLRKFAHVRANQAALDQAPGLIRGQVPRQADLYAAADLVMLPSTWEGWGLPVVEAACARKLIVAGPYPVLEEIRQLGMTVLDPSEIDRIADLLTGKESEEKILAANQDAVREHFDLATLPDTLAEFLSISSTLA